MGRLPFDARTVAFALADMRSVILYALGYLASVGVMVILITALARKNRLPVWLKSRQVIVVSRFSISLMLGSVVRFLLLAYPALLWIPISLFLVLSLGLAA